MRMTSAGSPLTTAISIRAPAGGTKRLRAPTLKRATTSRPVSGRVAAPLIFPPPSAHRVTFSESRFIKGVISPVSIAWKYPLSNCRWVSAEAPKRGRCACRCCFARLKERRQAASLLSSMVAISANSYPKTSCSRKTARSKGWSSSNSARKASEIDSSLSTRSAGSSDAGVVVVRIGSGNQGPTYTSRFLRANVVFGRALIPQVGLLHHILSIHRTAKHAVGDGEEVGPVAFKGFHECFPPFVDSYKLTSSHNLPPSEAKTRERGVGWGHPRPRQVASPPAPLLYDGIS